MPIGPLDNRGSTGTPREQQTSTNTGPGKLFSEGGRTGTPTPSQEPLSDNQGPGKLFADSGVTGVPEPQPGYNRATQGIGLIFPDEHPATGVPGESGGRSGGGVVQTNVMWLNEGDTSTVTPTRIQIDTDTGFEIEPDPSGVAGQFVLQMIPAVIPFTASLSGVPSNYSVFDSTGTINITASSGGTSYGAGTLNGSAAAVTSNGRMYTFPKPFTAQDYVFRATVIGEDSDMTSRTINLTGRWSVYVPFFYTQSASAPTSLATMNSSGDSFSVGDRFTLTGTANGNRVWVATPTSFGTDARFMIGQFEFVPRTMGTLSQTDSGGTVRNYNLFDVGPIDTNTRTIEVIMV